jgi:hypothetical protein
MPLRETGRRLRLRRTGWIQPGARVRHYDELDEDAQNLVSELAGRPQTVPETGNLVDGDVVIYTDYYQVRTR